MRGEENETARSAGRAGGTAAHTAQHLSMAEIAGFRNATDWRRRVGLQRVADVAEMASAFGHFVCADVELAQHRAKWGLRVKKPCRL
jgi:hypothetical protein